MIIINRHNYEEYFLLYTDNELDAAGKKIVEEFVDQHPDLKIELEMLQQSTLQADSSIVFEHKDFLLKNKLSIDQSNYEEYFVLYGDDELTNEQKDLVEQFVYRNSQYQADFELIQQVKLQPDRHTVFPDKTHLYRSEQKDEKVFVLRWWKIAAAAIVFIFLSGLSWYFISKDNTTPVIVKKTPSQTIKIPVPGHQQKPQENIVQTSPIVPSGITPEINNPEIIKVLQAKNHKRRLEGKMKQQLLTITKNEDKNTEGRNIQLATNVTIERPEVNIQEIKRSNTIVLQNNKAAGVENVAFVEEPSYAFAASNDEIEILNTSISKKNKLRGLIRKVTRVVEKTTNIEPGENVRGIRIANFEIALK